MTEKRDYWDNYHDIFNVYQIDDKVSGIYNGKVIELDSHGRWYVPLDADQSKLVCRFCGKSSPEVKFNHLAHTVSEAFGNKKIFNTDECDECNSKFGEIESHLLKMLHPFRVIGQSPGKKGIPSHKSNDGTARIDTIIQDNDTPFTLIQQRSECDKIVTDLSLNGFEYKLNTQKFIPNLCYKAMMKYAFSLLPIDIGKNLFKGSFEWLMHDENCYLMKPQYILTQFYTGMIRFNGIKVIGKLLKELKPEMPPFYFIIIFDKICLQIFVPFLTEERNKTLELQYYTDNNKLHSEKNFFDLSELSETTIPIKIKMQADVCDLNEDVEQIEKIMNKLPEKLRIKLPEAYKKEKND